VEIQGPPNCRHQIKKISWEKNPGKSSVASQPAEKAIKGTLGKLGRGLEDLRKSKLNNLANGARENGKLPKGGEEGELEEAEKKFTPKKFQGEKIIMLKKKGVKGYKKSEGG